MNHDQLYTPKQVSDYLKVALQTLANWRSSRRVRLPFAKVGGRILYRGSDVLNFLVANSHFKDSA